MKSYLILFLIGVTYAAPNSTNTSDIRKDIQDFLEIIPVEKIKKIAIQHLHEDLEFQAAVKYLKGPEWKALIEELMDQPEAQKLYNYLLDIGLDLSELQQYFCGFMKDVKVDTNHPVRSFKSFMKDVREVIPLAAVIEMFDKKLQTSPAFGEFYAKLSGKECHELVTGVRALPVYKKIVAELLIMGIDIEAMLRILHGIFNWEMKSLDNM